MKHARSQLVAVSWIDKTTTLLFTPGSYRCTPCKKLITVVTQAQTCWFVLIFRLDFSYRKRRRKIYINNGCYTGADLMVCSDIAFRFLIQGQAEKKIDNGCYTGLVQACWSVLIFRIDNETQYFLRCFSGKFVSKWLLFRSLLALFSHVCEEREGERERGERGGGVKQSSNQRYSDLR